MKGIDFIRDGLFGLRALRKRPILLIVFLSTLAISIGASTAIFSVVNSVLLRPLPYEEADRLVMVWQTSSQSSTQSGDDRLAVSYGDFSDIKESESVFEEVAGLDSWFANLTGVDNPERLYGVRASASFFSLMRVKPLLGSTFTTEAELPNANRVLLLSYSFWQRQFGGRSDIIGQKLTLNEYPYTIVGVLPPDFRFTEVSNLSSFKFSNRTDVYAPLIIGDRRNNRGFHNLAVVARLKPNVKIEQAQAEVQSFASQAAHQYPDTNKAYGMKVVPLSDQVTGDVKPVLLIIWAATGFVLLIASVNLALLLLARATTRNKELAVRVALGATRKRIIYQLLAESLFLSLSGGVIGVFIAYFGTLVLIAFSPHKALQYDPIRIDVRVLAFTLAASIVTALLFGLLPAFLSVKHDLTEDLKEGAHGSRRRSRALLQSLVVTEIALTIVLLVGAGLSVKTFIYLLSVDHGFEPDKVVTMDIFLPLARYTENTQRVNLFRQISEKTKALPEVESVGMNYALPFSKVEPSNVFMKAGQPPLAVGEFQSANLGLINADYFHALGIPLLQGRSFTDQDTSNTQLVAIIDERMAKQHFPDEDPLGRQITIASNDLLTIVGVVGSIKHAAFEEKSLPYVYLPFQQRNYSNTSFAIRSKTEDLTGLISAVRREIKTLDNGLPISNVTTLEKTYSEAVAPRKYSMVLLLIFAFIALFLTIIGIYGLMNYATEQRKREIGIRLALGAEPSGIFKMFIKQGMLLTLIGMTIGIIVSLGLVKVMASLVYGISPMDLITFVSISILTVIATFLACYLPAKNATKVNPIDILRAE